MPPATAPPDTGVAASYAPDDVAPVARPGRSRVATVVGWLAPALGLVVLFVAWELYVRIADVRPLVLPAPSQVVAHVLDEPGFYWRNAKVTLTEAGWGFALALGAAVAVATFMAHSRIVERAALPVIVLIQCTPVAVLAPVFLNWFGFSIWPKVLIAAVFAFVPFVINAYTGLRSIDPSTHELLQSVCASRRELFWRLRLPHSSPYLFSAARMCVGLALVGAVIGEMFGSSTAGLGNAAKVAQSRTLVDQLWGSIFVLAFMGVTLTLLVTAVERRRLRWHSSQTSLA